MAGTVEELRAELAASNPRAAELEASLEILSKVLRVPEARFADRSPIFNSDL